LLKGGKILVGGIVNTSARDDWMLVRYTAAGQLDTNWGTGGRVITDLGGDRDELTSLIVQKDGKIVAGGYTNKLAAGTSAFALARYLPDGSLDQSFGTGGIV